MNERIDRRKFALGGSALVGGCFLTSRQDSHAEDESIASPENLEDLRLIRLGINALARAAEMSYFADGHRGASLISAHMMCVDNDLDDGTSARIVELFDLNWASSKLCRPFPQGEPVPDATESVGKALADGGGVLRQVGHDAIFAMHAIKAFRMMPEIATRERVDGVCRLIRAFKPWRDVEPDKAIDPPPFTDGAAASRFILTEASDAIDRFVGFGQGYAGHMLTFGQSLVELASMGDVEWAESCRTAFCKYVTVTRMGPQPGDRKIKDHKFSKLRPNEKTYWDERGNKSLGLGHAFKYPYAYYDLLARANAPDLEGEFEAKAWHLF